MTWLSRCPVKTCATRCSSLQGGNEKRILGPPSLRRMGLLRGVIDSVSAKLAFFPPVPSTYEVHGSRQPIL